MVHLSGLDSNKYRAILRFKKYLAEHPEIQPPKNVQRETIDRNRETDQFGEVAATKVRQSQKRLTPEEIRMLIAEYQSGKEPIELSEKFGCHRITVGKILRRNNIPIRNTCPRKS